MRAEVSSTNRLVKAVAVMGSGTLISRVLGLVRLALIAAILGSQRPQGDMFWIANLIPNTMLLFLAGGVLNTVLVPQIVRALKSDDDGGEAFTNRIVTAFTVAIGALTVLLTLATPALMWIYTSGSWRAPALAEHYAGMVLLTYLCVPQLFFYGIFFLLGQVLNARDQFAPLMWAPIVNNVISIGVFVLYFVVWGIGDTTAPFTPEQILLLGVGSTIGIIAQFVVLIPFVRRTGFTIRPRFDLKGVGLGHTASLAKWTIYYVVVSQLVLIVVQRLASSATTGGEGAGMTVYSSAEMLWLLPHSLITVSLTTAMLSSASRLAAEHNLTGVAHETMRTIKFAVLLLVPASVAMIALANPIARVLLGHGSGAAGAEFIGTTLVMFSIGLVPYTIQFVCNRAFYALEDTRTAFFLQLIIAVLNVVLAIAFVMPFGNPATVAPGLALSVSVAYTVGVVVTVRTLKQKLPDLRASEIVRFVVRLFAASLPAGVGAWFAHRVIAGALGGGFVADIVGGLAAGLVLLGGFLLGARVFHIRELTDAIDQLRGRRRPAPEADEAPLVDHALVDVPDALVAYDPQPDEPWNEGVPDELIDTTTRPAITDASDDTVASIVESGQTLNHRYSLQDRLLRRGDTETWLAFDQVLSRLVLVHLLPTATPRLRTVLEAARKGAAATEARFLRVLDAVESDDRDQGFGGFVVCEYTPGQNLEELLSNGPVSAIEAAWIVREVADAMTSMHAQGLFHERLSPDTVLITASGNVKIVGFGVESALTPGTRSEESWAARERTDVRALGKLLYACLVHRWPGGDAYGMRAAPKSAQGDYLTPRQVRQGVSPVLDTIFDRILSSTPRRAESPLTTASEIVLALNKVLGTADASSDLENRLLYPTVHDRSHPVAADTISTAHMPVVMIETDEADFPAEPLSIRPPADEEVAREKPPRRRWLIALIALVVATLLISLAAIALQNAEKALPTRSPGTTSTSGSSPGSGATPTALQIVSGYDFDPDGDNKENSAQVALAFDGNPDTGWTTERYRKSANLGGLKPGVGIVLDLGEAKRITSVHLTLVGEPTSMELRVPAGDTPSKASKDWVTVASVANGGTSVDLVPQTEVTSRYVLIWLTSVPPVSGGRFQATIAEVQVYG